MAADRFPEFIDRLLSHEGGYTNKPKDAGNWTGGRPGVGLLKGTKFGIAANTYPNLDIKNLTRDAAIALYQRDFWIPLKAGQLPGVLGFQMLDAAVNSGMGNAARFAQRAARVADDGHIGPATLAAVKAMDPNDLAFRFLAERMIFQAGLQSWPTFGKGWTIRNAENLRWAAEDN